MMPPDIIFRRLIAKDMMLIFYAPLAEVPSQYFGDDRYALMLLEMRCSRPPIDDYRPTRDGDDATLAHNGTGAAEPMQ